MRKLIIHAITISIIITACDSWLGVPEQDEDGFADFESCWIAIDSVYPDFNLKGIDWSLIHDEYFPMAFASHGDEIIDILTQMLAELKDGHISLKTSGGEIIYPYTPVRRLRDMDLYDPRIIRNYFTQPLSVTSWAGIEYGITNSNIGYLYISSFGSHIDFSNGFDLLLQGLASTRGLIIDVRHNLGGNGSEVQKVVGHFISDSILNIGSYVMRERLPDSYISPANGHYYDSPVVILMNGVTYSAAESFIEIMKSLDRITAVGDTTGGGAFGYYGNHGPASGNFVLPSGRVLHVGTMDLIRYDGKSFEGRGIPPDIRILNDKASINKGIDRQLEYAISILSIH